MYMYRYVYVSMTAFFCRNVIKKTISSKIYSDTAQAIWFSRETAYLVRYK